MSRNSLVCALVALCVYKVDSASVPFRPVPSSLSSSYIQARNPPGVGPPAGSSRFSVSNIEARNPPSINPEDIARAPGINPEEIRNPPSGPLIASSLKVGPPAGSRSSVQGPPSDGSRRFQPEAFSAQVGAPAATVNRGPPSPSPRFAGQGQLQGPPRPSVLRASSYLSSEPHPPSPAPAGPPSVGPISMSYRGSRRTSPRRPPAGVAEKLIAPPQGLMEREDLEEPPTDLTMDQIILRTLGGQAYYNKPRSLVNGSILAELDMSLSPKQYTTFFATTGRHGRSKRKATSDVVTRWPNKTMPYEINTNDFTQKEIRVLHIAMREWEHHTCIKFRPATPLDGNRVVIQNGQGCNSKLGMVGGAQPLNLDSDGCRWKGLYLHEIGHALGLIHEHQLPMRDNYIRINYDNVHPTMRIWFNKYPSREVNTYGTNYQYSSVMHYGITAFSKDGQAQTIFTNQPGREKEIGKVWKKQLAFSDIRVVNEMYSCSAHCPKSIRCTGEGFLNKHCVCVCPDGTSNCQRGGQTKPTDQGPNCKDIYEDAEKCRKWATQQECTLNPIWMAANCKKSCKQCFDLTDSTPDGPFIENCVNAHEDDLECQQWQKDGECHINPIFMNKKCAKACGACKVTGCRDLYGDTAKCQRWAASGECEANSVWMIPNCRKSCKKCDEEETGGGDEDGGECVNKYGDDRKCEAWANAGECERNAAWMPINCRKACGKCGTTGSVCQDVHETTQCQSWKNQKYCDSDPAFMLRYCKKTCDKCSVDEASCINVYGDDASCKQWAESGQCESNTEWMTDNCKRACNKCSTSEACVNKFGDDDQCKAWADTGECTGNPLWMTGNCRKACNKCGDGPDTGTGDGDCKNEHTNDAECQSWASRGECDKNPGWMVPNCAKACGRCGGGGGGGGTDTGNEVCENIYSDSAQCDTWAQLGECTGNPTWMVKNCRKSCGQCGGGDSGSETCKDIYENTLQCQDWAKRGECKANEWWMSRNCKKSCNKCDSGTDTGTGTTPDNGCTNTYHDSLLCDAWAARGECQANPGFMLQQCQKSCKQCDDTSTGGSECVNEYGDDQQCKDWADRGECEANPRWMPINCAKACGKCDGGTEASNKECMNKHHNDKECATWASQGECTNNPRWMPENCYKACSGCKDEVKCVNIHTNDQECENWANIGECEKNPAWMVSNCYKACKKCDVGNTGDNMNKICENALGDGKCRKLAKQGKCNSDREMMERDCRKECTECEREPDNESNRDKCKNEPAECSIREQDGQCTDSKYISYMLSNCPKSCGLCTGKCENLHPNCGLWAGAGGCEAVPQYMYVVCRAACTKCGPQNGGNLPAGNGPIPLQSSSLVRLPSAREQRRHLRRLARRNNRRRD